MRCDSRTKNTFTSSQRMGEIISGSGSLSASMKYTKIHGPPMPEVKRQSRSTGQVDS